MTSKSKETGSDLNVPDVVTPTYIEKLVGALKDQRKLQIQQINQILIRIRRILDELPNVLEINAPKGVDITLVGDTHGQFFDVLHIFEVNGPPSDINPYLFNGDWVDRGAFGSEICLLLFVYKLMNPDCIHLLRGNHESQQCTEDYGFKDEILDKYNKTVYNNFIFIFNALPIASVINKDVFVVHGGLFEQDGIKIADINKINRKVEPGIGEDNFNKLMAQMLWADPVEENGIYPSMRPYGCSFGPDITAAFLRNNSLKFVVRSHQVRQDGFLVEHNNRLITLFSAPSYCGDDNKGAFIRLHSLSTSTSNLVKGASTSHTRSLGGAGKSKMVMGTSQTSLPLSYLSLNKSTNSLTHSQTISAIVKTKDPLLSPARSPHANSHTILPTPFSLPSLTMTPTVALMPNSNPKNAVFLKTPLLSPTAPPLGRHTLSNPTSPIPFSPSSSSCASPFLLTTPTSSVLSLPFANAVDSHKHYQPLDSPATENPASLDFSNKRGGSLLSSIPSSTSTTSICSSASSLAVGDETTTSIMAGVGVGGEAAVMVMEKGEGEGEGEGESAGLLLHAVFTSPLFPELSIYQFPKSIAPQGKEYFKPTMLRKEFW